MSKAVAETQSDPDTHSRMKPALPKAILPDCLQLPSQDSRSNLSRSAQINSCL